MKNKEFLCRDKRTIKILLLAFCIQFMASCEQKFDKSKWQIKNDFEYPYRNKMLKNLINNYPLKGKNYKQIIDILGEEKMEDHKIYYQITVDYGLDIDPVYTKHLEITFTNDSIANDFRVIEWEK